MDLDKVLDHLAFQGLSLKDQISRVADEALAIRPYPGRATINKCIADLVAKYGRFSITRKRLAALVRWEIKRRKRKEVPSIGGHLIGVSPL